MFSFDYPLWFLIIVVVVSSFWANYYRDKQWRRIIYARNKFLNSWTCQDPDCLFRVESLSLTMVQHARIDHAAFHRVGNE